MFSTFIILYNHHHYLVPKCFNHPQRKPLTQWIVTPHPPAPVPLATTNLISIPMNLPVLNISYINEIRPYVALCAWLFSLSITRLICILSFSIPAPGRQWRKISHCFFSVSPLVHWLPWRPISLIVTKLAISMESSCIAHQCVSLPIMAESASVTVVYGLCFYSLSFSSRSRFLFL